tara:strand:+ start:7162 stop:8175 length:1014 start_codon:yes stop_codon:yes gene_type:complete
LVIIKLKMSNYLLFYFFISLLNLFLIIFFQKIKIFHSNIDYPDNKRKNHKLPTPLAGGIIIIINLIFILIYLVLLNNFAEKIIFYFSCLLIFLLGFFDDKYNFIYTKKFILLSLIFGICYYFDSNFQVKNLYSEILNLSINVERFSFIFTLLCFLLFSNALNMFDGINLQCIIFSILTLLYLLILKNSFEILVVIICLLFLFYANFKNITFLGNSGSYLLSLIISYYTIFAYNNGAISNVEEIFIIFMLPGIDMLRLFFKRIINKKNPFIGDRDHIHHLLIDNFDYRTAILIISLMLFLNLILLIFGINKLIIIIISLIIYISTIIICYNKSKKINF